MKAECVKDKLRDAVLIAERLTAKNATLPILSAVLLIAEEKSLKIRATNLDVGVEVEIPAKISSEGITAVPGAVLSGLLSNLYEKTVALELSDGNMRVQTENSGTTIKSFPYEDFPTLPSVVSDKPLSISADKLISGIKSVFYSASLSDMKPEIASIYIFYDEGHLVFAATDSFRLAEKKIAIAHTEHIPPTLLPFKNISEIVRIFDKTEGTIEVHFDKNQISFRTEGIYVTSRVIDGVFPDYKQIMPKEFTTEAVVLKQDLLNALKISNVFSDKLNQVDFEIQPGKKAFRVHSRNFDVGENSTRIDAALSGENVSVRFNYRYVLDCLPAIQKDSISLQFNGEARPMVMRGVGDRSFTYLVMPLNR